MLKKVFFLLVFYIFSFTAFASLQDDFNLNMKDYKFIQQSKNVTRFSYKMVGDKFYDLYEKSPKSKLGEQSLYYAAETLNQSYKRFKNAADRDDALKYYKLLSTNFKSNLAADAYMKASDIYLDLKDIPTAKFMLETVISKYPKTRYASVASTKITEIDKKYGLTKKQKVALPQKQNPAENQIKPKTIAKNTPKIDTDNTAPDKDEDATKNLLPEKNAPRVEIKNVKYWSNEDYTRVVIELSGNAHFYKHWLRENQEFNKPPRLFVDIYNSVIDSQIPRNMEINDGLLKGLRWGIYDKNITRVVLDIDKVNDFTVFLMENPYRIVIDVSKDALSKKVASIPKSESPKPKKGKITLEEGASGHTLASAFGLKIKTVVIDPGHGGKDPGASYHGIMEKDINLDIALRVRKLLTAYNSDLKVLMTRETDVFIPLEERTAFANKNRADIFVSIHQNASRNQDAKGVETYVLNVTRDKDALAVAAFENQASERSLSDLQGILKDIMLNSKLEESLMLAKYVQNDFVATTSDKHLGVKQAPFYVLVGAKMPSILIECGFISNPVTANLYTTETYKDRMAEGIFKGLLKYIEHYNGK